MNVKKNAAIALALFCASFAMVNGALAANPPTNADELVAQHLDSIATSTVRAGLKSRVVEGSVQYKILVGGAGTLDGKAVLVSDGKKMKFMMKLPNNEYKGEQFIFNGDKDTVAFSTAQQARSALGNFVFVQDAVIREGLIGGTLSTAWPLLDLNERKPKLSFDGLKKVDGQEVYQLRYRPKKNSDLEITLCFDPQTYRHVETVYSYSTSDRFAGSGPGTGGGGTNAATLDSAPGSGIPGGNAETAGARQTPNRYRLTEKFSDFKTVDGVTLPTHDDIQFSQELQSGRTTLSQWDLKTINISQNMTVDPKNWDVK